MKRHGFGLMAQTGSCLLLAFIRTQLCCGWQDLGDLVAVV